MSSIWDGLYIYIDIFGVNGDLNEKKENKTKNNIRQINGSFVERVASYQ